MFSGNINTLFNSRIFSFTNDIYIKKLVFYGLVARFVVLMLFYPHVTMYADSWSFQDLADCLLNFDLTDYDGNRSPGYPLLMFFAFGKHWLISVYQFFIGVATFAVFYKTLLNLHFSPRISFILSCLFQCHLNIFFYETSVLIESLAFFFMVLLMYEISKGYLIKESTFKADLWMGFILGYLVLIKPFFAYIGFLVYGLYVLNDFKWRKLVSQKLIILIFPLFAYFGWSYVNKLNTGYFVSTSFFGLNLSQNCVYFAEKGPREYEYIIKPYVKYRAEFIKNDDEVAQTIWGAYENELKYSHPNFPKFSQELGKYAVETISKNPVDYIEQVICRSWFDFWKPFMWWEESLFNFQFEVRIFDVLWDIQSVILIGLNVIFLLCGFSYIRDYFKTGKVTFELFGVVLVWASSILQAVVTYGTNAKYRFPFEFIIFVIVILYFRKKNWIPRKLNTFLQQ